MCRSVLYAADSALGKSNENPSKDGRVWSYEDRGGAAGGRLVSVEGRQGVDWPYMGFLYMVGAVMVNSLSMLSVLSDMAAKLGIALSPVPEGLRLVTGTPLYAFASCAPKECVV